MDIKQIESRILELKGLQAAQFKMKKATRNLEELASVRAELNDLKDKAKGSYRTKK